MLVKYFLLSSVLFLCFSNLVILAQLPTPKSSQSKPHSTTKETKSPALLKQVKFDDTLQTALTQAVENDDVKLVQKLLKQRANPNSRLPDGDTAMIRAIQQNNLKIVQLLYEAGANLSAVGKGEDNLGDSPLMVAALLDNLPLVRFLVSKGAYVDQSDKAGVTPLIAVAGYDYVEVAQLLIAHGANINVSPQETGTALMMAAANGQKKMVELLLHYHANVQVKDKWGETALHLASVKNDPEIVALLRKAGAKE